jgi:hypothetical protein
MVEAGEQVQRYTNIAQPVHHACFMRPIIGSVAHLQRRCSCYVRDAEEGDDPALTVRQAAEAALEEWTQQQRRLKSGAEVAQWIREVKWPPREATKAVVFVVEPAEDGFGYVATFKGEDEAIVTQGDTLDDLYVRVLDAVQCHFTERPLQVVWKFPRDGH